MRGRVNGGYFDPNFAPIGLRIVDGKQLNAVGACPLVDRRDDLHISRNPDCAAERIFERSKTRCRHRMRTVPCRSWRGRPRLERYAIRSSNVCSRRSTRSCRVGILFDASLADVGRILSVASLAPDFKIRRALNLDGGSSSAFWFKRKDGSVFSFSEQKAVRDFVGVVPK